MTGGDVEGFCGKLDKAFAKFVKKHSHHLPIQPHPQGGGAEEGSSEVGGAEERGERPEADLVDEEDSEMLSAITKQLQLD